MPRLSLFARVPAYGRPAWHGPKRHPESTEHFNSIATLQHVARTLTLAPFDGVLVDPPRKPDESGAIDPWLCAMVLALAAPSLQVGFRNKPARKAGSPDPEPLLGKQWIGHQPPAVPLLSLRVLVAANRWMAEDQLEYVLQRFPQITYPARSRIRAEEDVPIVVGTPQEVTDDLERLLAQHTAAHRHANHNPVDESTETPDACWALELVPIHIPGSYEAFVRMVAPQLRHRGLIGEHANPWRPTI